LNSASKKPGVAFWASVVLVVMLVGYPLSFGPACWINCRTEIGTRHMAVVYRPICWAWKKWPKQLQFPIRGYASLGASREKYFDWGEDDGPRWYEASRFKGDKPSHEWW
jgi:hypothetical protein